MLAPPVDAAAERPFSDASRWLPGVHCIKPPTVISALLVLERWMNIRAVWAMGHVDPPAGRGRSSEAFGNA